MDDVRSRLDGYLIGLAFGGDTLSAEHKAVTEPLDTTWS